MLLVGKILPNYKLERIAIAILKINKITFIFQNIHYSIYTEIRNNVTII